jgi:hypothetical protein
LEEVHWLVGCIPQHKHVPWWPWSSSWSLARAHLHCSDLTWGSIQLVHRFFYWFKLAIPLDEHYLKTLL